MKQNLTFYFVFLALTFSFGTNGYTQWGNWIQSPKDEKKNSQNEEKAENKVQEGKSWSNLNSMEVVLEITNVGENWKGWGDSRITIILKGTGDSPKNGSFTTEPDGALSSANPKDYYRWKWDSKAGTISLMEKWPGQKEVILVTLSEVSFPFKSGDVGSGILVAPNKTRTDQPLTWRNK